jgi:MFS transporter, MHS family, proline/betaine transporter
MALLLPLMIATAVLSDRIGRKPVLLVATVLGFVGALPAFWLLNHHSVLLAFLGQLVLVLMIGTYGGTQPAIMVEAAPARVRCTAVALGYNICLGVVGGLTPLAATWLVSRTGDEISPAFLVMGAAAVTFATILRFRETYRAPFAGSPAAATACVLPDLAHFHDRQLIRPGTSADEDADPVTAARRPPAARI